MEFRFFWIGGLICTVLVLTGCPGLGDGEAPGLVDEVPENPTWTEALAVMNVYCNGCHSAPPQAGAPAGFRLDKCEDQGATSGAKASAQVSLGEIDKGDMPLGLTMGDLDKKLLTRWVNQGATCE